MSEHAERGLPAEFDSLAVGIVLYDPSTGEVRDANAESESLFGYATDELRTMTADEYSANTYSLSGAELVDRIRAAAEGSPQQFKWRVKRADGELIWVRFHLSQRTSGGRTSVLAEVHDITDYYTASRRLGLFSRILRHNLRNEGNVIAGHARQIEAAAESESVRETAQTIRAAATDLGAITESVREIERATTTDDGRPTYRNAADAVRTVADEFRAEYPDAEIMVDERRPMGIRADSGFTDALAHAVENAIVHNDDPNPRVEITIDSSPNTGRVEIRIADSGRPIPAVETDALDGFSEVTSTSHGSGVGLFVMKWCIESLGGELAFETSDDGNVISFYLPPKDPPGSAT